MARALGTKARFSIAYLLLGAAVGGALGAFIVLVQRPGPKAPPPWSAWQPTSAASIGTTAQEIASHVSGYYRFPDGRKLARVILGPSEAAGDVQGVALNDRPNSLTLYDPSRTIVYTLCGPQQNCALLGESSMARNDALRREALELALYTLKYANAADVAIFFPPLRGDKQSTNVLNFPREDFSRQLNRPLKATLPNAAAVAQGQIDPRELQTIDALTGGHRYRFGIQTATGGRRVLVLQPLA